MLGNIKSLDLVIKPVDRSSEIALATHQYQVSWDKYKESLINTFYKLTGLQFQQAKIIARVTHTKQADAGSLYEPMNLPSDYRPPEEKTIILIHELGHRLLSGNLLDAFELGLLPEEAEGELFEEFEHRLLYLFFYDAVYEILGPSYADLCKEQAMKDEQAHGLAWAWAMNTTFEDRQHALHILAQEAVPKEQWDKKDPDHIQQRDAEAWFKSLKRSS